MCVKEGYVHVLSTNIGQSSGVNGPRDEVILVQTESIEFMQGPLSIKAQLRLVLYVVAAETLHPPDLMWSESFPAMQTLSQTRA